MTLDVSTLLSQRARGMRDPLLSSPSLALLAAVLALALVGYDRLAGAGALVWTALRLPALWDHHAGIVNLAPEVLPVICFCVLVLAPRRRAPDLRRLAWLLVPATLVATAGAAARRGLPAAAGRRVARGAPRRRRRRRAAPDGPAPGHRGRGLTEQPRDRRRGHQPRRALAPWLFVAAAPLVLAAAITRTRRLLGATRPSSCARALYQLRTFPWALAGGRSRCCVPFAGSRSNSPGGSTMRTKL